MPVFVYEFGYEGHYSYCDSYAKAPCYYGAVHGDDLIYLLENTADMPYGLSEIDTMASDKLIEIYTRFARDGDPGLPRCWYTDMNPICKHALFYKNWSKQDQTGKNLLDIEETHEFNDKMVAFWDKLYTNYTDEQFAFGAMEYFPDDSKNKTNLIDEIRKLTDQEDLNADNRQRSKQRHRDESDIPEYGVLHSNVPEKTQDVVKRGSMDNFEDESPKRNNRRKQFKEIINLLKVIVQLLKQKSKLTTNQ